MRKNQDNETTSVEGSVEDIIFKSEDTGFCVLELNTGEELLVVVGPLAGACAGDDLKVTGIYCDHTKYGRQFKADFFERSFPKTSEAIYKYLASGVVKGIGPALARGIVRKFGDQALDIIEAQPFCLQEISGISAAKAERLTREFKRVFGIRSLMFFLEGYGVSSSHSVLAWKKWGENAIDFIKENPYILCNDDIQAPFTVADHIARKLEFSEKDVCRVKAGIVHIMRHNINNGFTSLPKDQLLRLVCDLLTVDKPDAEAALDKCRQEYSLYIVERKKEYIFLPEYYLAETYIASRLNSMVNEQDYYENLDVLIDMEQSETGIEYESLQREAIIGSQKHDVLILTGGPGTGKTTVLKAIIAIYEQQGLDVAIAAPTGRAAKRISEVTGRQSQTIHRLLGAGYERGVFQKHEGDPLNHDVIIIDETSMVDSLLFAGLLKAIKPGAKLILVGDHNQLPSVGAGNILRDMIESGVIPTVELKEIFRQSAQSMIVLNAHKIIKGEMPDLSAKDNDFFFLERQNGEGAAKTVVSLVTERLPSTYKYNPLEDIQVLSPARKGSLGIIDLNHRLQFALNPPKSGKNEYKSGDYTFRESDKVMQTNNDYDIEWEKNGEKGSGIFNGDIGIIRSIDYRGHRFVIDFEGRETEYPFDKLKDLELAYAVTVHKSQGNEFNAVILPLLGGYDRLYFRNLLYTAVTRAKKLLIIVGSPERVEYMVKNNRKNLRYTGLKHFLQENNP